MRIDLKIDSSKLLGALQKFPAQAFANVNDALGISAREIQMRARETHRFITRTGHLEASITTRHRPERLRSEVGLDDGVAIYGKFVHDGTKPHIIRAKNGKALRWPSGGKFAFRRMVRHPGTRPDKFIVDAGKALVAATAKRVDQAIEKAAQGVFA